MRLSSASRTGDSLTQRGEMLPQVSISCRRAPVCRMIAPPARRSYTPPRMGSDDDADPHSLLRLAEEINRVAGSQGLWSADRT